jgi:ATP-dependent helicase HrpB
MTPAQPLPIDAVLPDVVAALRAGPAVVVEAPPGAGKTTRIPRALLEAGVGGGASRRDGAGEVWVLEPRRLPARLAAERVAAELGERVGDTVGYTVRFDDVTSKRTRLRFVTEGLLVRRLLDDPRLDGIGALVLDELHERHVATDLALALGRRLQQGARPDLRLCAMSATLDAAPLAAFLGGCPTVRTEGRLYPVEIEHLPAPDERPLAVQVTAAVRRVVRESAAGDVLVFLPGAAEIRQASEALASAPGIAGSVLVLPLHGDMPLEEQARATRAGDRRKVILSTNVAESSITIEGVVAVVDAGLARIATHSPWTGLPELAVAKISQAAAVQRAGRAGRTGPGRALRLYTRHDFDTRKPRDVPEIARADLADTLLALAALEAGTAAAFPWFEAPPPAAVQAAETLLVSLGALEGVGGRLTPLGRRMLRFPVHPRLARLVCEGEARGVAAGACLLAALVSERDIRRGARASFGGARGARGHGPGGGGDGDGDGAEILELVELYADAERAGFRDDRLRALGLDARAVSAVSSARRQLAGARGRGAGPPVAAPPSGAAEDAALRLATLAAFPDRVGRRRALGDSTLVLAGGGTATLGFEPGAEWLVAVDVQQTSGRPGGARVRLAAAIEPEWLLDVAADRIQDVDRLVWNADTARVERVTGLVYGALALEETVAAAPPGDEASRMLAQAAGARGIERLAGGERLGALLARMDFVRGHAGENGAALFPVTSTDDVGELLRLACAGRVSFAELAEVDLADAVLASLPGEARRLLGALAPERVSLPSGRSVAISYRAGQPPWIESRLQDFFGMREGPAVAGGRVPLTLHLLAPNNRAVQVTTDLRGFWAQHYPELRRALSRRYPKHAWPEDGATAKPPPPPPPRGPRAR